MSTRSNMKLFVLIFCLFVLCCNATDEPNNNPNKEGTSDRGKIRGKTPVTDTVKNDKLIRDTWSFFKEEAKDFADYILERYGSLNVRKSRVRDTSAEDETVKPLKFIEDAWNCVKEKARNYERRSLFKRSVSPNQEIDIDNKISTRIFGGTKARDPQFPYQALLSYNDEPYCGATIIHERWALTARHCILDNETDTAHITVGTTRLDGVGGVNIDVDEFIPHLGYNYIKKEDNNGSDFVFNDIGLIHLKSPVQFTNEVRPVPLPSPELPNLGGKIGTVAGWGHTGEKNSSEVLLTAHVRLLDRKTCQRYWPSVRDLHLCTSIIERKSICLGDSGGALVVDGRAYGLISSANDDCKWPKPNLYVDLTAYVRWIQAELERFGDRLFFEKVYK